MDLQSIIQFLDETFHVGQLQDFPNAMNGLQVGHTRPIHKIVGAVDANVQSIQAAIQAKADLLCVHHGLFWSGQQAFTGSLYEIYQAIFKANLAIYSLHLPLDSHLQWGHNATIAQQLNLNIAGTFAHYMHQPCGLISHGPMTLEVLSQALQTLFPTTYRALKYGPTILNNIGIVAGSGGMDLLNECVQVGIDTLITGEIKYSAVSFAQLHHLNIFACGHYATECFGVKNMLRLLEQQFHLPCSFLDFPCTW